MRRVGTTWWNIMTAPRVFFGRMPPTGGLYDPLAVMLFAVGVAVLTRLVRWAPRFTTTSGLSPLAGLPLVSALLRLKWLVIVSAGPVVSVLVFELAAICIASLGVRVLCRGRTDLASAVRVVGYSSAPFALAWVPWLFAPAAFYSWYLLTLGFARVRGVFVPQALAILATSALTLAAAMLLRASSAYAKGLLTTLIVLGVIFGPLLFAFLAGFFYLVSADKRRLVRDGWLLRRLGDDDRI
jgi:hypothetical protein